MRRVKKVEGAISGMGGGVRFDRVDESLPWTNVKYEGSLYCSSCAFEKHGICWVKGLSVPENKVCNVEEAGIEAWKRSKEGG